MARTPKVVQDRREQIIDAAMLVFSQKGFVRATNKDIAREAGITPGLIYHYFESKEALLTAIIEGRSPLKLLKSLTPEVLTLPPEDFFRFIVRQVLAIIEEEKFVLLIRVFLPEVIHNQDLALTLTNAIQRVFGFLGKYVRVCIERGELREVDEMRTAQVIVGCVISFVLRRQVLRDPMALQLTHGEIIESVVDTVLQGLLPR
jgi:AcrR family transcriptional regulator